MLRRHGQTSRIPGPGGSNSSNDRPLIDALLTWRKDERIATTFGWHWLDEHVRDGGFVASGRVRMAPPDACRHRPASTIFHRPCDRLSPPSRPSHRASRPRPDRARVLAAVSGDRRLIDATRQDDLYAPIARALGVERDIAKVAVLGAM